MGSAIRRLQINTIFVGRHGAVELTLQMQHGTLQMVPVYHLESDCFSSGRLPSIHEFLDAPILKEEDIAVFRCWISIWQDLDGTTPNQSTDMTNQKYEGCAKSKRVLVPPQPIDRIVHVPLLRPRFLIFEG